MQEQKPQKHTEMEIHPHCQHQYLNRKFTGLFVEIQFDEQQPIRLQGCSMTVQQLIRESESPFITQENHLNCDKDFQHNHPQPQSFILINYQPSSMSKPIKRIQFLIPISYIMCVAKKSSKATLLMVKDKQKQIQLDENGYQLVSDQQDEEQFVQVKNQLYEKIKKSIVFLKQQQNSEQEFIEENLEKMHDHHHFQHENQQVLAIKIDKKCNITLTPQPLNNFPQHITSENTLNNQSIQLYDYLSHKLQEHEKLSITKNQSPKINTQWKGQLNIMKQMYQGSMEDNFQYDDQNQLQQDIEQIDDDLNEQEDGMNQDDDDNLQEKSNEK